MPSIWDTYCEQPGNIVDHSSGAVACDQYHRYAEDIGLMKQLGVSAYRLSIAWPRIVPEPGKVNDKGIEHYVRLLDALRDADIKPVVTRIIGICRNGRRTAVAGRTVTCLSGSPNTLRSWRMRWGRK